MSKPLPLESKFAEEVLWRFCSRQSQFYYRVMNGFGSIHFDARYGAIVLGCPNSVIAQQLEHCRDDMEAIASALGATIRVVVTMPLQ